jgi:Zn-dependent M28 family amino/carboxypeptidase
MTRLTSLTLCLLTALLLACRPITLVAAIDPSADALQGVADAAQPALEARAETAPSFSGTAALQHVQALSATSRVAGSPEQTRTHQYLLDRFQELGYQTELQPFTINAYQDRGSKVSLSGALGQSVTANTLQYSAGGSAEAELVEAGLGRPDDFAAADVRGKIALVTRGETRFADQVDAATAAGAVAVIIANTGEGNFNGSLAGPSSIPAVSVSQADGATLRQAIRGGSATVRVDVNASSEQSTGANVVATKPGGPRTIVVGAHIDSVAAGPGANDNGSGTSVVLELARTLATQPTPFTLQFVGFDAEEIGLVGSNYFVSQLSEAQRQSVVGMINLDMVGVGDRSLIGGSEDMMRLARATAARTGLSLGEFNEASGSDHASFMRAGIPALFIYRSNDPNYHSPNDRAEYVDPANLQIAGSLALDVIAALERGE